MTIGFWSTSKQPHRESRAKVVLLSLLAIVATTENTAHAGADCTPGLYGASFAGRNGGGDGLATLYSINPANGIATRIGATGFERISAMDVDPTDDTLYAIAERLCTGTCEPADRQKVLISIDRLTGAGTEVAEISLEAVIEEKEHIAGMSFDSSGALYGFGSKEQGFYAISVPDGTVDKITVNDLPNGQGNGIAFSPGDILYHLDSDNLRIVDPETGVLTLVDDSLEYSPFVPDDPKPSAIDYGPETGLYYAIVKESTGGEAHLATVDVASGIVHLIGTTSDFMDALTYFSCEQVQPADIDIEKSTNGEQADTPPGPSIEVGQPVTWTYVVTNTGQVTLNNIAVNDDILGAINCPQTTLAPAAAITCTANGFATAGQYENVGDASGTPPDGPPVTDSDPSHYLGIEPSDKVFWDGFETL